MAKIRSLFASVVKKGWLMFKLDVNNTFFYGNLDEENYVTSHPSFEVPHPYIVWKLKKFF